MAGSTLDILDSSVAKAYVALNQKSHDHALLVSQRIPTGMSRALLRHPPFSAYTQSGSGVYTTDLDGNQRIDFHGNYAALIHGHGHPAILDSVTGQLAKGTAYSTPASLEWDLADHLCQRIASVDRVLFNNSGTEAVQVAIRAARAFTGRNRIAKFEGGYHGFSDFVMAGGHGLPSSRDPTGLSTPHPDTAGLPDAVLADVLLIRYNDVHAVKEAFRLHGASLAAVIVEPMLGSGGVIPATVEFLQTLREETERAGVLLICDEVITLRQGVGGMQSHYELTPDLTTMGKIIGGGFPIGAVGGRAAVMSVFEGAAGARHVPNMGTFSANPVSLAAGLTALKLLDAEAIKRLASLGERARQGLRSVIERHALAAQVSGFGSMFQWHWTPRPVTCARIAEEVDHDLKLLTFLGLSNRGIQTSMRGMCSLSTPMDASHIDHLVSAFDDTVGELMRDGWGERMQRKP